MNYKRYLFLHFICVMLAVNMYSQSSVMEFKAKKDSQTQLWGYENTGKKQLWWEDAHSLGKNEELLNSGYNTEWLISPQYDRVAKTFSEGLAAVELNGKVGFIDKQNRFILPPQFDPINKLEGFNYGLAAVKLDDKYGFIDKKGNFVIPPIFDYAENFDDNLLATVKIGNKYGAIDFKGDTVVPCRYIAAEAMKVVPVSNKLYRQTAKTIKTLNDDGHYDEIKNSISLVADEVNKLIRDSLYNTPPIQDLLIEKQGDYFGLRVENIDSLWVIQPEYDWIKHIADDFYLVDKNKKFGINDGYGRTIIPCEFAEINYSPDGKLFIVRKDLDAIKRQSFGDFVGLYDHKGAMIIPQVFEAIDKFDNGMALASISDIWTIIDTEGRVEDGFINNLLEVGLTKKGADCVYFYNRIIGLRPRCAQAHNNLGIHDLELENYKEGMQKLKLANKLAPDDNTIAENLKQAKKDRKERRFNRISNAFEVAAIVVGVAAATYSVATGNASEMTNLGSTIDNSDTNVSTSQNNSSNKKSNQQKETKQMNHGHYTAYSRVYDRSETELSKMEAGLTECDVKLARDYQRQMRHARKKILEMGGTRAKSTYEDWVPCSKM